MAEHVHVYGHEGAARDSLSLGREVEARVWAFDDGNVWITVVSAGGGVQTSVCGRAAAMRELGQRLIEAADASDEAKLHATLASPGGALPREAVSEEARAAWRASLKAVEEVADRNAVQRIPRSHLAELRASDTRPETVHSDADGGL